MTPRQALLAAMNGEITRPQLMEYCGIVKKEDKYVYKRKETVKKEFVPPALQEVIDFFRVNGYNEAGAKKAYQYYSVAGWKDSKGKPVVNWKQKMIANWFKDEYKSAPRVKIIDVE